MMNFVITLSKFTAKPLACGSWSLKTDVDLFFSITRPQNGQIPGINEEKRRRKLVINKDE